MIKFRNLSFASFQHYHIILVQPFDNLSFASFQLLPIKGNHKQRILVLLLFNAFYPPIFFSIISQFCFFSTKKAPKTKKSINLSFASFQRNSFRLGMRVGNLSFASFQRHAVPYGKHVCVSQFCFFSTENGSHLLTVGVYYLSFASFQLEHYPIA